jgi:hypothetical protein
MKMTVEGNTISLEKETNRLDELAIEFSKELTAAGIKHIFLSGYVAILFGRNRASEDVDVVCQEVSLPIFSKFWTSVGSVLECIIISDAESAYRDYLREKTAVRFARKGEFVPNVEMKFATTSMHREALANPIIVLLNGHPIPISPFEQQIAYKLYMGSDKDVEDARFMFQLFREHLDLPRLAAYLEALSCPMQKARRYLGWSD